MSGFDGYDQWKTASPFDDHDDEHCAYCGADLPDDVTGMDDATENAIMDGFCDVNHAELYEKHGCHPQWGNVLTPAQEARLAYLQKQVNTTPRAANPMTLADYLEHLPDGDFSWDGEPGDWHVYCCGEKDCPQQWHLVAYYETIKREAGKLSIEWWSCDSDGNHDIDTSWEEGQDWYAPDDQMDSYFRGWAEYWLDAAVTGNDPCGQIGRISTNRIDHCLDAAADQIKYLRMNK